MLVLRKEVKVALGAAAAVVGIALVYGLMATLSSSGDNGNTPGPQATEAGASTLDVTGATPIGPLEQAVSGLPPKEDVAALPDASADPLAESARNDGKSNIEWSPTLFNSGKVPVNVTPALAGPRSFDTGNTGNAPSSANTPLVTRTPSARDTDPTLIAAAGTYIVQPGDNFSRIAGKVYGNRNLYKVIVDANPTLDPAKLKPGMTINVPARDSLPATTADTRHSVEPVAAESIGTFDASRQYRIQPGDTLHKISIRLYGKSNRWASIYDLNKDRIGPDAGRLKLGVVLTLPEPPTLSAAR